MEGRAGGVGEKWGVVSMFVAAERLCEVMRGVVVAVGWLWWVLSAAFAVYA